MSGSEFLFILSALVQPPAAAATIGSAEIVDRAELMDLSQSDRPQESDSAGAIFVFQQRRDGSTAVRLNGTASEYVFILSDPGSLVTESVTFAGYPRVSIERWSEPEPAGSGNRAFAVIAHFD